MAHDSCEGRLDHVMANIDTLFHAPRITSIPLYLVSAESLSCLLRPCRNVVEVNDERCGRWCSLVPVGRPCPRVTTTGLKYNVSKYLAVYYQPAQHSMSKGLCLADDSFFHFFKWFFWTSYLRIYWTYLQIFRTGTYVRTSFRDRSRNIAMIIDFWCELAKIVPS